MAGRRPRWCSPFPRWVNASPKKQALTCRIGVRCSAIKSRLHSDRGKWHQLCKRGRPSVATGDVGGKEGRSRMHQPSEKAVPSYGTRTKNAWAHFRELVTTGVQSSFDSFNTLFENEVPSPLPSPGATRQPMRLFQFFRSNKKPTHTNKSIIMSYA